MPRDGPFGSGVRVTRVALTVQEAAGSEGSGAHSSARATLTLGANEAAEPRTLPRGRAQSAPVSGAPAAIDGSGGGGGGGGTAYEFEVWLDRAIVEVYGDGGAAVLVGENGNGLTVEPKPAAARLWTAGADMRPVTFEIEEATVRSAKYSSDPGPWNPR